MSSRGVLLVEDDPNDVFFMCRAMSKAGLPPPAHVAVNGQEALDYLNGAGKYSDRASYPLPKCIFLDLKLPLIQGFEVLEYLRQDPCLKEIPVFILTSSSEASDRKRAADLGAKAYLLKPPMPENLANALASVGEPILAERAAIPIAITRHA